MLLRKMRLQRGWSQEHLAELTGLSARTIQRIERGHPCSMETLNALASVFETDISTFKPQEQYTMSSDNPNITVEEKEAMKYVEGIKSFYTNLWLFVMFVVIFFGIYYWMLGYFPHILYWIFGYAIALVLQGLCAFEIINFFNPDWERKQIEKRLKHKL